MDSQESRGPRGMEDSQDHERSQDIGDSLDFGGSQESLRSGDGGEKGYGKRPREEVEQEEEDL